MGTGSAPAGAHVADDLAGAHCLAGCNRRIRHMGIERLDTAALRNDDIVAVSTVPRTITLGNNDCPTRRGVDGSAALSANINTIPTVDTLREATARERVAPGARGYGARDATGRSDCTAACAFGTCGRFHYGRDFTTGHDNSRAYRERH